MKTEPFALLDVFVAAVEAGSFAGAARRLHRTRSAVGKGIARLEERLGVRLFLRDTRHSSLTEQGQLFYEHALRASAELLSAIAALDRSRDEPRGRVRVTMPVAIGRRCVAPLLMALGREHPALELDLSFTDRVVDVIHEGVDLALRVGPLRDSSDLVARRLGDHRMLVCGAPAYLHAVGRPDGPGALTSHRCLTYGRNGRHKPWQFHDAQGRVIEVAVTPRWRFDDLEAIRDAALAGDGLARLPNWLVADDLRSGALQVVFDEPRPLSYEMHAVWPRMHALPLKTRVVVDTLVAQLPPLLDPIVDPVLESPVRKPSRSKKVPT
jgi:DNA-binding transcriptional LysR family regulator